MEVFEQIKTVIGDFAGYKDEQCRRLADEQIRAFAGERLAGLAEGDLRDRLLRRCEFINQAAFARFKDDPSAQCIDDVLAADLEVIAAAQAGSLERLSAALDRRDDAMLCR